ncbi:hypothetical protein IEE94_00395 [Yimella sp. cx-573]|nr:hypothetical protein [Yimella sp. cx-573]
MLSWEHLKVAGFLAIFSGFTFALVSASDARLREAVNDSAGDLVREASAVRLALLGPRREPDAEEPASDHEAESASASQKLAPTDEPNEPTEQ